jgi:hypothetical protein
MTYVAKEWNEKQSKLKEFFTTEKTFDEGIELLLEMHSLLHDKKTYKNIGETYYNALWDDLKEETCKIISSKETSILWNIWHITRIEDIVSNILIGDKEEILNNEIQTNLNIKIKDTGNAMTYSEIELFNNNIKIKALNEYRSKVGKQTTKIIKNLKYTDMKKKVKKEQLEKIKQNGGVLDTKNSIWLLDFWGKKNIFGLIMMPITRHQIVHLNDCLIIKKKYNK